MTSGLQRGRQAQRLFAVASLTNQLDIGGLRQDVADVASVVGGVVHHQDAQRAEIDLAQDPLLARTGIVKTGFR